MTLSEEEIRAKIMNSFKSPTSKMRSAFGIASDTGLPIEKVVEFMKKHPELFQEARLAPPTGSTFYIITNR